MIDSNKLDGERAGDGKKVIEYNGSQIESQVVFDKQAETLDN